jgi:hypothetical protein
VTWTIWPRDADLGRTLDPISVWSDMTVVERHISNGPPTWILTGPSEHLSVFTSGMGCIIDDDTRADEFVASGQARSLGRSYRPDENGRLVDTTTLGFIGDSDDLWSRLCWPDPTHALTGIPSAFTSVYDERTGARETLLLEYIAANLGPAAPIVSRRLAELALPTTLGRGGSTTYQARMDVLGEVVATLAEAGDLDVRVEHDESTGAPRLLVVVEDAEDVSADVVFGAADIARATGIVSGWDSQFDAPELTDAILFSTGDLELREGSRFTDEAAVVRWGRRRERLIDQGYTDDLSVITDAGAKALEDGASPTSLTFDVTDAGDAIYGVTYRCGSKVGIELPGLPLELSSPRVREVTTSVAPGRQDERTITVGSPGATSIDPPDAALLDKTLRRVAKLERNH